MTTRDNDHHGIAHSAGCQHPDRVHQDGSGRLRCNGCGMSAPAPLADLYGIRHRDGCNGDPHQIAKPAGRWQCHQCGAVAGDGVAP